MPSYQRAQQRFAQAAAQAGRNATLIKTEQSGPSYAPRTTETRHTVNLIQGNISLTHRDSTLVQTGDRKVYIDATVEPELGDKLELDEHRYSIVDLQPVQPASTAILYEALIRR